MSSLLPEGTVFTAGIGVICVWNNSETMRSVKCSQEGTRSPPKTDRESCPLAQKPIYLGLYVQQKDTSSALESPQKTETGSLLGDKKHPNGSNKGMHFLQNLKKAFQTRIRVLTQGKCKMGKIRVK